DAERLFGIRAVDRSERERGDGREPSPILLLQRLFERGDEGLEAFVLVDRVHEARDLARVREAKVHVARVTGDGGKEIGVSHRLNDRAEPARRLSRDPVRTDRKSRLDEKTELVDEILLVVADRARSQVLRSPVLRER